MEKSIGDIAGDDIAGDDMAGDGMDGAMRWAGAGR